MIKEKTTKPFRLLWIILGHISVGLAFLGAVLPLVPTTPFLLLAAACYSRGSDRFYNWLYTNKFFGKYLKDYQDGKGVPVHVKILALSFMWISTLVSIVFLVPGIWFKMLVMVIPVILTIHILTIGRGRNGKGGAS
jgi:uncharacterized membrane protein YbaN (DUF454 family)